MINIVKGLLTRDAISRKNRKWHLLTPEEMEKLHKNPRCISRYGDDEEISVIFLSLSSELSILLYM
jgi:hypothetical protein